MTRINSRWIPITVILGFFLLLGSLEALSLIVGKIRLGRPVSFWTILQGTVPSWIVQLALAWPVRWLSQRARLGPGTWSRRLPIHVLGAFLFTLATVLGTAFIFFLEGQLGDEPVGSIVVSSFFAFAANQVAIYGAMVAAFHALDYLQESEQRERERARLAASLTEARLNALRSQLRPHFFFNTLNAISTFALDGRPERVADMVGALGELVRASLDDELPHEVPLQRELELLGLYVDIQRMRFEDWLRLETEIAPETAGVLVPSLLMQPLVENAIEHGGQDAEGLNRVRIRCSLEGACLSIVIENTRPAPGREPGIGVRLGVGLRNTMDRLEQLYPGEHEIHHGVVEGGSYRTTVRIPARRAPEAERQESEAS